jgi:hypothetical protein
MNEPCSFLSAKVNGSLFPADSHAGRLADAGMKVELKSSQSEHASVKWMVGGQRIAE